MNQIRSPVSRGSPFLADGRAYGTVRPI